MQSPDKLVSVIITIYDEPANWIEDAIASIQNQTYKNLEIIIVNDNPSRIENANILKKFSTDNRIITITNPTNLGLPSSLNKAIEIANGDYIARMDADDISLPKRIQTQVNFLNKNPEIGICGTFAKVIDSQDNIKKQISLQRYDKDLKLAIWFLCPFIHPTIMVKTGLIKSNKYDTNCRTGQDWELWFRLADKTKFANIPLPLLFYRIHKNQSTIKAGVKRNLQSMLYANTKKGQRLKLSGEILDIYVRSESHQQVSRNQLDMLYLHLSQLEILKDSHKYLIFDYTRRRLKFGIFSFFINPIFLKTPFRFIRAIISETTRIITAHI